MYRPRKSRLERISWLISQQTEKQEQFNKNFGERHLALLEFFAVFVWGCIFVLIAASWSSPLFKDSYGYDSAWYSTVGRAILSGYVPYKDLFDLKGPAFFFYEALGQLFIKGRHGVFLIQCISAGASALLLHRIAKNYLSRSLSWVVLLLFYFPYIYLLWGGNTTEELFMPLNFAAIWMGLRFLGAEEAADRASLRLDACLMGLFAGVFIYSKITSGAPLFAVILAVSIGLIRKKRLRELLECALFFLLGIVLVSLPIFAYFIFRGALKDMIHCVFVLGLKRSTDYYISFSMEWERNLMICPVSLLMAVLLGKYTAGDAKLKALRYLILISAPVIYLLLHLGSAYTYYFITVLPLWGLDLILVLRIFTGEFKALTGSRGGIAKFVGCILLMLLVMIFYFGPVRHKIIENIELVLYETDSDYVKAARETFSLIPEWERDRLYNIESGFKFYEINRILPNNKYSVNIPYFLHLDDDARVEFMELLIKNSPKWIVTEGLDIIDIPEFQEYMFRNYTIVAENDYGLLYRRNER